MNVEQAFAITANRLTSVASTLVALFASPTTSQPLEWSAKWVDEPYRFKVYRHALGEEILDGVYPVAGAIGSVRTGRAQVSTLLRLAAGLTQKRFTSELPLASPAQVFEIKSANPGAIFSMAPSASASFRAVPSGGGLYPWEVYVVSSDQEEIPAGVYHYSAVRHALTTLRNGEYYPSLQHLVPKDAWLEDSSLAIVITAVHWKNYFKYAHTCIRLHALDTGVLLNQIQWVAKSLSLSCRTVFQFLDSPIAELLGLDLDEETVQAIVFLGISRPHAPLRVGEPAQPSRDVTIIDNSQYERSTNKGRCSLAREYGRYSMLSSSNEFVAPRRAPISVAPRHAQIPLPAGITLPPQAAWIHRRRSGIEPLSLSNIQLTHFAGFCQEAVRSYPNDVDSQSAHCSRVGLFAVVNRVVGLKPGIYAFLPAEHALSCVFEGRCEEDLQSAYHLKNINLESAAAVFFATGDYVAAISDFGNRGLRILNLEAGIIANRFYVTAALLGFSAHAILGFDVPAIAKLLRLEETTIQPLLGIAIGKPIQHATSVSVPLWL